MSAKQRPNSWDDYLAVHQSRIADFLGHFIVEDRLEFSRSLTQVYWEGVLICADGIEIHVRKRQSVSYRSGRAWVQATDYAYHVLRRRHGIAISIVRYDNASHHHHPDPHNRHRYDVNGTEVSPPEHMGEGRWPTLGEVIEESFELWNRPA